MGQEVEELEDEADVAPAVERRARAPAAPARSRPPTRISPERRAVDPAEQVQERRLAASGLADEREELAGRDLEVEPVERDDRLGACVDLADGPAGDGGRPRRRIGGRGPPRCENTARPAARTAGVRLPMLQPIVRALWAQRALVAALVRRELSARYRGGALGFLWSFLNPLLLLLVYATVFRFVFAPRADVRPYALFLFGGVLVWGFVSSALADAVETFRVNGPLLRKTTVAPEVFPAVAGRRAAGALLLALPVLAAAIVVRRGAGSVAAGPRPLEFPVVLALLVAGGLRGGARASRRWPCTSATCATSSRNLLTLAFFLTPVLYPAEAVPERWRWLLRLNPFASFFAAVHDTLFFFRPVRGADWMWMAGTRGGGARASAARSSSACATRSRRRHERRATPAIAVARRRPRSTGATRRRPHGTLKSALLLGAGAGRARPTAASSALDGRLASRSRRARRSASSARTARASRRC